MPRSKAKAKVKEEILNRSSSNILNMNPRIAIHTKKMGEISSADVESEESPHDHSHKHFKKALWMKKALEQLGARVDLKIPEKSPKPQSVQKSKN